MTLTFYYLKYSGPVRSVDLVIHGLDLKVDYKIVNVLEKEQFTPEYLKLNPLHTVPLIVDEDGFVLWESRAIMTYLVSKYGKDDSLYPKDLKQRAIVDQRLHFSNDVFFLLKQIIVPLVYHNQKPIPAERIARVKECQENIEKLLDGNLFIAGDHLTVADYSFITLVDTLEFFSPTEGQFPQTTAWFERCKGTMKDFDKVNSVGAKEVTAILQEKLKG